eukprot:Protomagalhaensia_wolfi_Nauph_80__1103@NODE_1645_length_1423_cov_174_708092_g1274_i0_p2_GENE_NODE_1645_length_1423_cov_174_708092_g1274_i0NODE_1645_length_1423_cov_174_708092_g1274_i0_p2_ORF_typecomplete_len113_score5_78DUF1360/PF07098_11/0_086DUF123/PF01986_16/0_21_NODE_1645_length_1423_cov_174_708092_g1274_i0397735
MSLAASVVGRPYQQTSIDKYSRAQLPHKRILVVQQNCCLPKLDDELETGGNLLFRFTRLAKLISMDKVLSWLVDFLTHQKNFRAQGKTEECLATSRQRSGRARRFGSSGMND